MSVQLVSTARYVYQNRICYARQIVAIFFKQNVTSQMLISARIHENQLDILLTLFWALSHRGCFLHIHWQMERSEAGILLDFQELTVLKNILSWLFNSLFDMKTVLTRCINYVYIYAHVENYLYMYSIHAGGHKGDSKFNSLIV
jgi:hypothetical protein